MNRFHTSRSTPPNARRSGHRRGGLAGPAVLVAVTALATMLTPTLAGCSSGQISQSARQASAVNGTEGVIGDVALRDVRMQAVQSGDSLPPGQTVDLVFVASNQSTDTDDELTAISTDIGKVSLTGGKKLPTGGILVVGTPAGGDLAPLRVLKELRGVGDADVAVAAVALDKPISNGLTYDFTFDFKQAGSITLAVPISAGPAPGRPSAQPRH